MNIIAVAIADYTGLVILLAMLVSSHIRRSAPKYEFKIFTIIAKLAAAACVIDFLMFYCDGMSGFLPRIMNVLGNTYCFIANPIFACSWCIYTDLKLYSSKARIKRIYRFAAIPGIILVAIGIINTFVPIIFYVDSSNVYHRLPFSYVFYAVEAGYLIYSLVIVKQYEKRYDKVRFFPMYLMLGPIVIGCVLQIMFYGVSLIWVSVSIGLTSIYMSLQNEFSYLDTLTGLYNRAFLDYQLEICSKSPDIKIGGIMIDVDYFKTINDSYGHSVGDEALIDVARVILFSKPDSAIAVRFAGDEFILLIKDCSEAILNKTVEEVRNELKLFNENECRQYDLSLSMGAAMFDYEIDDVDSFFKKMDDNMYKEKNARHAQQD